MTGFPTTSEDEPGPGHLGGVPTTVLTGVAFCLLSPGYGSLLYLPLALPYGVMSELAFVSALERVGSWWRTRGTASESVHAHKDLWELSEAEESAGIHHFMIAYAAWSWLWLGFSTMGLAASPVRLAVAGVGPLVGLMLACAGFRVAKGLWFWEVGRSDYPDPFDPSLVLFGTFLLYGASEAACMLACVPGGNLPLPWAVSELAIATAIAQLAYSLLFGCWFPWSMNE